MTRRGDERRYPPSWAVLILVNFAGLTLTAAIIAAVRVIVDATAGR